MNAHLTLAAVKYFAIVIVAVPVIIAAVYHWVLN
jgi:hypothetical protein